MSAYDPKRTCPQKWSYASSLLTTTSPQENLYSCVLPAVVGPTIGGITVKSALGRLRAVIASPALQYNYLGGKVFWNQLAIC